MKRAASVAAILILVLAGTAAFAACPGACARPVGVQCPQPCAAPCPQPCPKPCPQACPKPCPATCCPASVPASIGAGPDLAGLECPDFDPAYARKLYEQNATIIAVTEFGGQRTGIVIVNLKDPAEIPAYAEPWFLAFGAKVEFHPAMIPADLAQAAPAIQAAATKYG